MSNNARGWTVKNPDGSKAIIHTVEDLLNSVNPNFNFCLAAAAAFVFLGTAEEFIRLHSQLEADPKIRGNAKCEKPWLSREIIDYYRRTIPSEKEKYIVVMEGDEVGPFWLRCEFEKHLNKKAAPPKRKRTASPSRP